MHLIIYVRERLVHIKQNFSCITTRIEDQLYTCVVRIIVADKTVEYIWKKVCYHYILNENSFVNPFSESGPPNIIIDRDPTPKVHIIRESLWHLKLRFTPNQRHIYIGYICMYIYIYICIYIRLSKKSSRFFKRHLSVKTAITFLNL